jgi:hypothetical protein
VLIASVTQHTSSSIILLFKHTSSSIILLFKHTSSSIILLLKHTSSSIILLFKHTSVCKDPQNSEVGATKVDKHFESNSEMHMAVCKLPAKYIPELKRSLQSSTGGGGSGGSSSSGDGGGGRSGAPAMSNLGALEPSHYYDGKSLVAHNNSGLALGLFRRIDLKTYANERFAFALLYFTGSKELNLKMRYRGYL